MQMQYLETSSCDVNAHTSQERAEGVRILVALLSHCKSFLLLVPEIISFKDLISSFLSYLLFDYDDEITVCGVPVCLWARLCHSVSVEVR